MCLSLVRDSSEIIEGIIIKLGTVTASDMGMHLVLLIVILTLTFIQGRTGLNNRENKKCSIFF